MPSPWLSPIVYFPMHWRKIFWRKICSSCYHVTYLYTVTHVGRRSQLPWSLVPYLIDWKYLVLSFGNYFVCTNLGFGVHMCVWNMILPYLGKGSLCFPNPILHKTVPHNQESPGPSVNSAKTQKVSAVEPGPLQFPLSGMSSRVLIWVSSSSV